MCSIESQKAHNEGEQVGEGARADDSGRAMLLAESDSSVAFTNILFAVSLGIMAILGPTLKKSPQTAVLLVVVIVAAFYSSIFYAVVAGNIARLMRLRESKRAILIGNALSEYLGVLVIVPLMPLLMWLATDNQGLTWMTYAIDLAAYALYAFSGFDLLTRVMPSRPARVAIAGAYVTVLTGLVYGVVHGVPLVAWASTALLLLLQGGLTLLHIKRGENG